MHRDAPLSTLLCTPHAAEPTQGPDDGPVCQYAWGIRCWCPRRLLIYYGIDRVAYYIACGESSVYYRVPCTITPNVAHMILTLLREEGISVLEWWGSCCFFFSLKWGLRLSHFFLFCFTPTPWQGILSQRAYRFCYVFGRHIHVRPYRLCMSFSCHRRINESLSTVVVNTYMYVGVFASSVSVFYSSRGRYVFLCCQTNYYVLLRGLLAIW